MHRVINFLNVIIIILMIIYLDKQVVNAFGGSIVLILLSFIIIIISSLIDNYKLQVSFFNLLITSLLLINFLSFIETNNLLSVDYLCGAWFLLNITIAFIFYYFCFMLIQSRKMKTDDNDLVRLAVQTKVLEPIILFPIIVSTFIVITGLNLRNKLLIVDIYEPLLAFLMTLWIIIGFLAIIFVFNKLIKDKYFSYLMAGTNKILVSKYKLKFIICVAIIITIGSGAEIVRGWWFLWFETIVFLIVIVFASYSIARHILQDTNVNREVNPNEIVSIRKNSKYLIALMALNFFVLIVYDIILSEFL